jgi:putative cell wall-binding protein
MQPLRRPLYTLALATVAALVGSVLVATPAAAVTTNHDVDVDAGVVTNVWGEYTEGGLTLGSSTTTLHVTLPAEALALDIDSLGFRLGSWDNDMYHFIGAPSAEFDISIPSDFYTDAPSDTYILTIFNPDANGNAEPGGLFHLNLYVQIANQGVGTPVVNLDLSKANADSNGFQVSRNYDTVDPTDTRVSWGDTLTVHGPAGFWTGGPEAWAESYRSVWLSPSGFPTGGGSQVQIAAVPSASGDALVLTLPASAPANVNWSTGTFIQASLVGTHETGLGTGTLGANSVYLDLNFFPTSRLAGADRYSTAATVSAQFESAETVYIASGVNYPDALSAAPAAAHVGAPLLLTAPDALPQVIIDEIKRLDPSRVVIAGGLAAVSQAVENKLNSIVDGSVVRFAGVNRYDTSRLVTDDAFGTTANAFLATGSNFPDALAASAAAAHLGAPVILVPGTDASVDAATLALLDTLAVEKIYLAGGTAVVSSAIKTQLTNADFAVTRLAGDERYATSVAINALFDPVNTKAFLAVGTGYADALAGAALAGAHDAPLFTVPGNCVPDAVLAALDALGATDITLLGGTAVLTLPVAKLVDC